MEKSVETSENGFRAGLDSMADLHERIGKCETVESRLSRRITALEEANRGQNTSDDPMKMMIEIAVTLAVLQVALPFIIDLIAAWRGMPEKQT